MNEKILIDEIRYKAIRSGGPGGQHANKVSSKVVGTFSVRASRALSSEEKLRIEERLGRRLNSEGDLAVSCDASRSQHRNKALVEERMLILLKGALRKARKRIKTQISGSVKKKRSEKKIQHSQKKQRRKRPNID